MLLGLAITGVGGTRAAQATLGGFSVVIARLSVLHAVAGDLH